jgi:hypothetical protein
MESIGRRQNYYSLTFYCIWGLQKIQYFTKIYGSLRQAFAQQAYPYILNICFPFVGTTVVAPYRATAR